MSFRRHATGAALYLFTFYILAAILQATPGRASTRVSRSEPVLYEGTVERLYAPAGRVALLVSRVGLPDGTEVRPTTPQPAVLLLGANGRRPLGGRSLVRRIQDLRPGDTVRVVTTSSAPGNLTSLEVLNRNLPLSPLSTAEQNRLIRGKFVRSMFYPVIGPNHWHEQFLENRHDGLGPHKGEDLVARKMTPIVAAFAGQTYMIRTNRSNYLAVTDAKGWTAVYIHMNNDLPGGRDNHSSARYAFAAGLESGDYVVAGQLLGYVGDSGNATGPHLHFEMHTPDGMINPAPSLRRAQHLKAPRLPVSYPNLQPAPGEERLDGFITALSPERGAFEVAIRARWKKPGRRNIAAAPQYLWVMTEARTEYTLAGAPDKFVDFDRLALGTPVTILAGRTGTWGAQAPFLARQVAVEIPSFLPSPELDETVEAGLSTPTG